MPRRSLWLILITCTVSMACYLRADRNPYGRWISEVMETIDDQYIEPVDNQKLFEEAMRGIVSRLDDYSSFMPHKEKTDFEETLDQQYGGIGIELALDEANHRLVIMNPRVGAPAYRAGMHSGDVIEMIDGVSTRDFRMKDASRHLRGMPGTAVAVTVRRKGIEEPLEFHLVRAVIKVDSVLGDLRQEDGTWNFFLPGSDHIGYVRVNSFGESTMAEFEAALRWLAERHCRGLVIDLRDNPGGLLNAAEQMCDLFVERDALIVTTRGRNARVRERYVASGDGPYQKLPLVVLVNERSASASEIVAACLQDHGRAAVVGERTFGKGTVQNVIPVEGGRSLLKLTIASYWRPSGKNIHRTATSVDADQWGVRPDANGDVSLNEKQAAHWLEQRHQRDVMAVAGTQQASAAPPSVASPSPVEFDPQLERAVEVLRTRIAAPGAAHSAAR